MTEQISAPEGTPCWVRVITDGSFSYNVRASVSLNLPDSVYVASPLHVFVGETKARVTLPERETRHVRHICFGGSRAFTQAHRREFEATRDVRLDNRSGLCLWKVVSVTQTGVGTEFICYLQAAAATAYTEKQMPAGSPNELMVRLFL